MAMAERTIPLLIEPDPMPKLDISRLTPGAKRLYLYMTAKTSQDLSEVRENLGGHGGASRNAIGDRPKVCLGVCKRNRQDEALLIYKNTGGGATEDNLVLTPLVSLGVKAQVKLDKQTSTLIEYQHPCVSLETWLDENDWKDLSIKFSEKHAIRAWKRHLVRVWASFFPLALIKAPGSRTKGATSLAQITSLQTAPKLAATPRHVDNLDTDATTENEATPDETIGPLDWALTKRNNIISASWEWWTKFFTWMRSGR